MTSGPHGGGSRRIVGAGLLALALSAERVASAERDLKLDPPEVTYATSSLVRPVDPPAIALPLDRDNLPELVGASGTWRGTPLRQGGIDITMRSQMLTSGIATRGDLDGDGDDDLVVAHPCALAPHPGLENCCAGRILVFWAPRDLPDLPADYFGDAVGDWTLIGGCETTELGTRLAVADVNGDGVDDLIAGGIRGWDGFSFTATCLYGVFGPLPTTGILDLFASPADFTMCAPSGSMLSFGESLAAGDFDGDTVADIAVSGGDGVHIFRGQRLVGDVDWATPDMLLVLPATSRGAPVADNVPLVAHEVDGDGRDDLLIGLAAGDGEVDLVLGRTPLPAVLDLNVTLPDLAILGSDGANLGASVAVGHWTPDAALDLVMGTPGSDGPSGTRADAGALVVVEGLETLRGVVDLEVTAPAEALHGVDAGDAFGSGISGHGLLVADIGGDGIDDITAWSPGARGVANFATTPVGETSVIYGKALGPFDLMHSANDPSALSLLASDVASPWDGAPGLLDDGDLHFFQLEEAAGVELTIFVTKQEADQTVRISWWDGRASSATVDPLSSTVSIDPSCARNDARSAVTLLVVPRDSAGELLGAGLDVGPVAPDSWLPGVPTGGFRDLGNGSYELGVAAASEGSATFVTEVEDTALASAPAATFSATAPSVTVAPMPRQQVGIPVAFTATVAGGVPPFTYEWDLDGDATVDSVDTTPTWTFLRPGRYVAVALVTDVAGCGARGSALVTVEP